MNDQNIADTIHCQEFHELAMDYRGASVGQAPTAYKALCGYIEGRLRATKTEGGEAVPEFPEAACKPLVSQDADPMPKRTAFIAWCKSRALDADVVKDAWGNLEFKHSHIQAMWEGWFNAPTDSVPPAPAARPSVPIVAQSIGNDQRFRDLMEYRWNCDTMRSIEIADCELIAHIDAYCALAAQAAPATPQLDPSWAIVDPAGVMARLFTAAQALLDAAVKHEAMGEDSALAKSTEATDRALADCVGYVAVPATPAPAAPLNEPQRKNLELVIARLEQIVATEGEFADNLVDLAKDALPCARAVMEAPAAPQAVQAPTVLENIEQYRLQMAGISTAALGYWKEGDSIHPDYDTVPLRDVAKLYAKYVALYQAATSSTEARATEEVDNFDFDLRQARKFIDAFPASFFESNEPVARAIFAQAVNLLEAAIARISNNKSSVAEVGRATDWHMVCGDWRDDLVAIHGKNGHIVSGLTTAQARSLIDAHSSGATAAEDARDMLPALQLAIAALEGITDRVDGTGFASSDEFAACLDAIDIGNRAALRTISTSQEPASGTAANQGERA